MLKNDLCFYNDTVIRILEIQENNVFYIDCVKRQMPKWCKITAFSDIADCTENELLEKTNVNPLPIEKLSAKNRKLAYERYTMIAGVLPYVQNKDECCNAINRISEQMKISNQTIRHYLCLYLAYQSISALAMQKKYSEKQLTTDEKNMRWALNKFFYTKHKNSLNTAYTLMLKEKYCDSTGTLFSEYPSMYQFRYFYRKHKNMQTYYISRNGLKDYQRNNRPLTGDRIQSFAPSVGVGMLDATVCDIYLVNEAGGIVGRPILTACIDAYSSLCCGYSLSWEGGVYSLRGLMCNVLADKVQLCNQHGISLEPNEWACNGILPGLLVTDMGSEYKSENFEQIAELGITVINLPAYRPELKGAVEKFFDVIQGLYIPHFKGKGVIESDYQARGSHDYRKDACLTMTDFEKIILRCIVYYNSQRTIKNFPYSEQMLAEKIKPYASAIWNFGLNQVGANLISADYNILILTLLPRTTGKFSRKGLIVNKLRYKHDEFTERYLNGGTVTVAYNPDDVSEVWLIESGVYTPFTLIESRFCGKGTQEVKAIEERQKIAVKATTADNIQAKIDLVKHISVIANAAANQGNTNVKGIRENRKREQQKTHRDFVKDGETNG